MCAVQHMSSCISTKLFAKSVEVAGWRLGWVGVGEGWSGDGGAVVMIQDGAKLILAWGCLSRGWHVEVQYWTSVGPILWSNLWPGFWVVFGLILEALSGSPKPKFFQAVKICKIL